MVDGCRDASSPERAHRKPMDNRCEPNLTGGRNGAPISATLTFKFRVSPTERSVIRERARGYPSPAELARRTLVAEWSLPISKIVRVTDSFLPIQK